MDIKCTECLKEKPVEGFSKCKSSGNGYQAKCKACAIVYMKSYHTKNRDKCNAKTAECNAKRKAADPEDYAARRKKACDKYTKNNPEARKETVKKSDAKQHAKNPGRRKARKAVSYAIATGKLVRGPCQCCGTTLKVEAHHESYEREKWLEVTWLCFRHHRERHIELNLVVT